jgi:exonuclease III
MRVCCWNVRRASHNAGAWRLLEELSPDLVLLQEVNAIPPSISSAYDVVMHRAAGKSLQNSQRFSTAILVRGTIGAPIPLSSRWDWVNQELEYFRGNLVAYHVTVRDQEYRVLSAYCPAWPVAAERLHGVDVDPVKLTLNPQVWVTELLWAALLDACNPHQTPWIVGGDLNSSETFDYMWGPKPRGNREILDRMYSLGLRECLRETHGMLVPTFRNPKGGRIVHQMDHLFVPESMTAKLVSCKTADHVRVFGESLSDHLPIIADFSDF